MVDNKILFEILKSREDRVLMQKRIINKYNHSLISFTLNIPGSNKDSIEYRKIHNEGMKAIINTIAKNGYSIEFSETIYKGTGAEGFVSLDIDPIKLKNITTKIEDTHELGRLFDIDVFDYEHNQISRNNLGAPSRKCLLCNEDARICGKLRTHSLEELLQKINDMYHLFFQNI